MYLATFGIRYCDIDAHLTPERPSYCAIFYTGTGENLPFSTLATVVVILVAISEIVLGSSLYTISSKYLH